MFTKHIMRLKINAPLTVMLIRRFQRLEKKPLPFRSSLVANSTAPFPSPSVQRVLLQQVEPSSSQTLERYYRVFRDSAFAAPAREAFAHICTVYLRGDVDSFNIREVALTTAIKMRHLKICLKASFCSWVHCSKLWTCRSTLIDSSSTHAPALRR